MAKAEIDKGQDELKQWVSDREDDFEICNHVDPEIIAKYAEVIQYIAKHFDVEVHNLYHMMRQLKITI